MILRVIVVSVKVVGRKLWHDEINFLLKLGEFIRLRIIVVAEMFVENRWRRDNIPFMV